jgi:membrane protease YdiL (CAAX protease family)
MPAIRFPARFRILLFALRYTICELRDFGRFMAQPRRAKGPPSSRKDQINRAIFFALAWFVVSLPLAGMLNVLEEAAGIRYMAPRLTRDVLEGVFVIGVVGPVLEELVYRAGLRVPVFCLILVPAVAVATVAPSMTGAALCGFTALALWTIAVVARRRAGQSARAKTRLAKEFIRSYPKIFHLNCYMFAIAHASTYQFAGMQAPVIFILVFPLAIGAAVMGYLRIRDGLASSMFVHCLYNLTGIGFIALAT